MKIMPGPFINISGSGKIYYLKFQIDKPLPLEKDNALKVLCQTE